MSRISHHSRLTLGASEFTQEPSTQNRLGSSSAVLVDRASSPILTFSASIQELSNPLACLTLSVPSAHPLEDFQKLDINPDPEVGDLRPPMGNSQATDKAGVSRRAESVDREVKSPLGKSSERLFLYSSSPCSPQQSSSPQVSFSGKAPQQLQLKSTTGDQSKSPSSPPRHRILDDSVVSERVASTEHGPPSSGRPSQCQGRAANEDGKSVFMVESQPNVDRPSSRRGLQPLSPCQISATTGLQSPAVDPPQVCQPVGLLCPGSKGWAKEERVLKGEANLETWDGAGVAGIGHRSGEGARCYIHHCLLKRGDARPLGGLLDPGTWRVEKSGIRKAGLQSLQSQTGTAPEAARSTVPESSAYWLLGIAEC